MARKIDLNQANGFGGAVVIQPPGGGESVSILTLDGGDDPAFFWATLQSKIGMLIEQIRDRESGNNPFGMRRS